MLIYTTIALLATLLPVLAGVHTPPPALRHRRLAESANHKARALINKPAEHVALEARANAAHADAHRAVKKAVKKRAQTCRAKTNAAIATSASSAPTAAAEAPSSTWSPTPSSTWAPAPSSAYSAAPASSSTVDNQQAWAQQNNAPAASASSGGGGGGGISVNVGVSVNVGGLLQITNGACGWCGSSDSQPNGSEDWLNCGLNNGGWNPPYVACSDLVAVDLDASGVFSPCSQYIDLFNQFGNQYNVHPIMLASFAMQESTCNAGATGGNGEAGLMQIAPENCQAGNNCWDPTYNIQRGAQLFSQMVSQNGGNCIAAIGSYNGWYSGMTYGDATAAASQGRCAAQQNLDYLFQFTNGWMQNQNAESMGQYFNLNNC